MELKKPYYAVIFTNLRTEGDNGYGQMAEEMEALARKQSGFLGFESARDGMGIAVSYWESLEAVANWKSQLDHKKAQKRGIETWYSWYKVRICRVEREYEFNK
ncbi:MULTISPECIES: antibiotic biosynthesis monooxygenase [Flavobacteriaceae]|jgi:heme-degrading monooxygenase HmoA|uniref:Polysaccharide biosynthesis protein n=1 Tax=Flagellimonas marinaquae TaxID=254955 RepID=A0AA48H8A8_9FLAO|nr:MULTISPECIES: antibiotic biosynthesis monooxygenase [Allomuricauda]MCA0958834.1 antibiotic biosynthesis monooxygenase [Allomuricauda ruestringensis]USD26435.1 antibiotic biosynthesis monooxygenase [Allomuricauda aquimarina]BDW92199.1 polysaccharide biosynthesis protein [Allomuricauda aquimarina]